MDAYVKGKNEQITIEFDMREFVARVAPEAVTFVYRAEPGLVIGDKTMTLGLIEMTVGGGIVGRVYKVGIEASTVSGQSISDTRLVRLRAAELPPIVIFGTPLLPTGLITIGGLPLTFNLLSVGYS